MRSHLCFRVLGISSDSSLEEVKEAYRRRIKEFHPDVFDGDVRYVLVIREAYESLLRPENSCFHLEKVAEELFPGGGDFDFPEFSREAKPSGESPPEKSPHVGVAEKQRGFQNKKSATKEEWLRTWVYPQGFVSQKDRIALVSFLLERTGISLPPVSLEKIAAFLGIELQQPSSSEVPWRYNRDGGALCGGNIAYDKWGKPTLFWSTILSPHFFYERYAIARLLGYFLYYPLRQRAIMVGDFLSFFNCYDEEEINTHRFAEELLLPEALFSVYGGKVLWYMERGNSFSYDKFIQKTSELFKAPKAVVEHRARKYERRIRIMGTLKENKGRGLLKEVEELFR